MTKILNIGVLGKPRMTRRDKWAQRKCVQEYRAWATELRYLFWGRDAKQPAPLKLYWEAQIAMPRSWSNTKKNAMRLKPHTARPDRDNIDKAICDALFLDDAAIAIGAQQKVWGDENKLIITVVYDVT